MPYADPEERKRVSRESRRRIRAKCAASGICIKCCKRPKQPGKISCVECEEYDRQYRLAKAEGVKV